MNFLDSFLRFDIAPLPDEKLIKPAPAPEGAQPEVLPLVFIGVAVVAVIMIVVLLVDRARKSTSV